MATITILDEHICQGWPATKLIIDTAIDFGHGCMVTRLPNNNFKIEIVGCANT